MENDSFLKKFQGRTEVIGREGILGIMNNVHINVNDHKLKPKQRLKKKKNSNNSNNINSKNDTNNTDNTNNISRKKSFSFKDEYSYITSEVSKEFNQNKNFVPQLKSSLINHKNNNENLKNHNTLKNDKILINKQSSNTIKVEKNNKNNNRRNSYTNTNKPEINNRVLDNINKSEEKANKLFKSLDIKRLNKNIISNKIKNINNNKRTEESLGDNKNLKISLKKNQFEIKNNQLKTSKSVKLPLIPSSSGTPKNQEKNIILKNLKISKSFIKSNNNNKFSHDFKNILKNKIFESEKKNESLKEVLERNNKRNFQEKNINSPKLSVSLPKIHNNKIKNNDFQLLDSLKHKPNNLNSDRNFQNIKINDNIKISNKRNNRIITENNLINNNINRKNSFNNMNDNNISNKNNSSSDYNNDKMNNMSNLDNYINKSNNIYNNRNYYNNDSFFGYSGEKRSHTSFDSQPKLPGLKEKLDVINEEDEDDNKFITDFNNVNNGNLNALEILMKQRLNYQNQLPTNSRFKLKPKEQ